MAIFSDDVISDAQGGELLWDKKRGEVSRCLALLTKDRGEDETEHSVISVLYNSPVSSVQKRGFVKIFGR